MTNNSIHFVAFGEAHSYGALEKKRDNVVYQGHLCTHYSHKEKLSPGIRIIQAIALTALTILSLGIALAVSSIRERWTCVLKGYSETSVMIDEGRIIDINETVQRHALPAAVAAWLQTQITPEHYAGALKSSLDTDAPLSRFTLEMIAEDRDGHYAERSTGRTPGARPARVFTDATHGSWLLKPATFSLKVVDIGNGFGTVGGPLDHILRPAMAERIRTVITKRGLEHLAVAEKGLLPVPESFKARLCPATCASLPSQMPQALKDYMVFARIVPSHRDIITALKALPEAQQRQIADQICTVIIETGISDINFGNVILGTDGKMTFIDTEPMGALVHDAAVTCNPKHASIVGLGAFCRSAEDEGLTNFVEVIAERFRLFTEALAEPLSA